MNKWIKKDLKYIWHPYTQMKDCQSLPPILVEKAKGTKIYDSRGNFYYDTISSWWCNVHGHNHPKIKAAVKRQLNSLEHILFAGFTHKPAIELAQRLISITPKNLTKIFFSDNGSTAVEVALKMAYQYWQNRGEKKRIKFISLDYAYHGDTIGTMSVSGVDLFNEKFSPLFFSSFKVPAPYCYRCPMGKEKSSCDIDCLRPLRELLENKNSEIAAMILEPLVLAAAGMIIYPKEYLIGVRKLTKKFGVHLILDEVATAFGRTGKMFASEFVNVQPEFMCLSKGITSGYLPLGVTLTTQNVYQAFYADYKEKKTFYHGHTYTANPISCSAAIASLEIFQEEDALNRINKIIPLMQEGMARMRGLPYVGDVRNMGLIGAVELVKNKRKKTPFRFDERIGYKIYKKGLKKHLILRPLGNIIYLFLPLCIKRRELVYILDSCYKIIRDIE